MRLIDADALLEYLGIETTECTKCKNGFSIYGYCKRGGDFQDACYAIDSAPTVDAVPVVRCKDCKHRPTGTNRDDLEFPDDKCPCQCDDFWYSWKPSDDWFCGNGERKDGERG